MIQATGQLELPGQRVVLLIVGDGSDRARLEAEAANLPAQVRVIFTGRVPYKQAPLYISLADICTMPRTRAVNERIGLSPIKLFSYLACGKPVIATRIRGLEILEAKGLGSLAPFEDAKTFSALLHEWLEDQPRRAAAAPKARRYAEENCGWDRTARAVYAVCREMEEKLKVKS